MIVMFVEGSVLEVNFEPRFKTRKLDRVKLIVRVGGLEGFES